MRRPPEPTHRPHARAPEGLPEVNAKQDQHNGTHDGTQPHAAYDDDEAQDANLSRDHADRTAVEQRHAQHVREGDDEHDDGEDGHGEGGDDVHPAGRLARAATGLASEPASCCVFRAGCASLKSCDVGKVARLQDHAV